MLIADVLAAKGSDVATVPLDTLVDRLLELLAHRRIGAVVVTAPDGSVAGIVSERDVVRQLNGRGAELLVAKVWELMTRDVRSCSPGHTVDSVLATMTEHRIRHVPVVEGGALLGLVSIGDLVKTRIDELQAERDHLTDYINS